MRARDPRNGLNSGVGGRILTEVGRHPPPAGMGAFRSPRSGVIYVAQGVSLGERSHKGRAAELRHLPSARQRDVAAPRLVILSFRLPNAHALGYVDSTAPRCSASRLCHGARRHGLRGARRRGICAEENASTPLRAQRIIQSMSKTARQTPPLRFGVTEPPLENAMTPSTG